MGSDVGLTEMDVVRVSHHLPSAFIMGIIIIGIMGAGVSAVNPDIDDKDALLPLFRSLDDLPVDMHGRLSQHLLLVPESCLVQGGLDPDVSATLLSKEEFGDLRTVGILGDELSSKIIYDNKPTDKWECPKAFCFNRGTPKDHFLEYNFGGVWPPRNSWAESLSNIRQWAHDRCQRTHVGWINYIEKEGVDAVWVSPTGERNPVGRIEYGERRTLWISSFLGHKFEIYDRYPGGSLLREMTIEFDSIFSMGEPEPHPKPSQEWLNRAFEDTRVNEMRRSKRIQRKFTPVGFQKGMVPKNVMGAIYAYFYNNLRSAVKEEWGGKGIFVNWWEVDPLMVTLPPALKNTWHSSLLPVLERWVDEKLEATDLYGIRIYQDGAILTSHVDREETHAVSVIINVDQNDMRNDWLLEIFDVDYNVHEVPIAPGEMIYYESAKCLHGRPKALEGKNFSNVFVHYRPTGDPRWFLKDKPPYSGGMHTEL